MATNYYNYNEDDLCPGEISKENKNRFNFFKTSYSIDFTKKN